MVSSARPRYGYTLDAHDRVISVSPLWLAFARENGAAELTESAVIGRSLWDFIDGRETNQLYRTLLQRVRSRIPQIVVPFRCDSPTLRRYMRLEITRKEGDAIQLDGILERVEPTTRLNLLDRSFPRSGDTLTLCSCCRRALVEPLGWLELEDATARLHLLEVERVPQLRNSLCPDCLTGGTAG